MEIHEGTSTVKEAKLYLLKGNFSEFTMKKDESIAEMFNRLNDIVNDLKGLGFEVPDGDFNHKFLRCLPKHTSRCYSQSHTCNISLQFPLHGTGPPPSTTEPGPAPVIS